MSFSAVLYSRSLGLKTTIGFDELEKLPCVKIENHEPALHARNTGND